MHTPEASSPAAPAPRRSARQSKKPVDWWASNKTGGGPSVVHRTVSKRPRSPGAVGAPPHARKRRSHVEGSDYASRSAAVVEGGSVPDPSGGGGDPGNGCRGNENSECIRSRGAAGSERKAQAGSLELSGVEDRLRATSVNPLPSPVTPWEGLNCRQSVRGAEQGSSHEKEEDDDSDGVVFVDSEDIAPGELAEETKSVANADSRSSVDRGEGELQSRGGGKEGTRVSGGLGGKGSTLADVAGHSEENPSDARSLKAGDAEASPENRSDEEAFCEGFSGSERDSASQAAQVSFARSTEIQFSDVEAMEGSVSVAIALSVNNSYSGILNIPPQTDTGAQRALKGDEFFFVEQGHVMLEIGSARHLLHAGDHIAVPHMQCYAFHNQSSAPCRLVFFVPMNPFG